ncbi:5-methyltetrahydropteroyltriglutamate--homocysteine methyltransferase-like isoform X2 [Zingiber officinale]|nr:5-methyltetrahydropteroyltriglutamate--homocysteine methyltransferase-like isoform X2 [Zingiber officinale]
MASHIVGYPCMGPKRELQTELETFWSGESSSDRLQKVAADLRSSVWKQMADAGIKYIPSNTFSYFDQMLDTTAMLGAVPERYNYTGDEIGFDIYCLMARGNASAVPALKSMEKRQWFDTNKHFSVPELGPNTNFSYSSHKAVSEYKEAKALGIETVPVLIGPVTYLLLSEPAKGVEKSFCPLSLLESILPIYKEVIVELKAAGASWIQFDEPTLVLDLQSDKLHAFTEAYSKLESSLSGLNVLVETYFAGVPAEAYKIVTALKGVSGFGFDLVRGIGTVDLIKTEGFPAGKYLFAGVVNGRNIWANDHTFSLSILEKLEGAVDKDKLVVSTSCSLMHIAVDLDKESKLDDEIKSWLAFAAQKVIEVNALAKALVGPKGEASSSFPKPKFSRNLLALLLASSEPPSSLEINESELSKDLLHFIFSKLSLIDLLICGDVCTRWCKAVRLMCCSSDIQVPQAPPLFLWQDKSNEHTHYVSLWEDQMQIQIQKNSCIRGTIIGFAHGWLIIVAKDHVYLIDPITHVRIDLPLITFVDTNSWDFRGTLSSPSSPDGDFTVIIIFSSQGVDNFLIFANTKDEQWTHINTKNEEVILDATLYKGKIYAVTNENMLTYDLVEPHSMTQLVDFHERGFLICQANFFYTPEGDLMLTDINKTSVKVWKVDLEAIDYLERMDSLDPYVVFVSRGASICIESSQFLILRSNSIYFFNSVKQVMIYSMLENNITTMDEIHLFAPSDVLPIWFTPILRPYRREPTV